MSDQAQQLRHRMQRHSPEKQTRKCHTIAVTSGKGGVGKTNFTLNFAIQLAKAGYHVVVIDADLGMANADVLMGIATRYTLFDLMQPHLTIHDVMASGPHGIRLLTGKSGFHELFTLTPDQREKIIAKLKELHQLTDFIIIDTGAGLMKHTLPLILTADEVVLVTTPEPTALTDGYAVMKYLFKRQTDLPVRLLINRAANRSEAEKTGHQLKNVVNQFLQREIHIFGYLLESPEVIRSVKRQQLFSDCFPHSSVSKHLHRLTSHYLAKRMNEADVPRYKGRGFMRFLQLVIRGKI